MAERQKGTLYVFIAALLYSIGGLCIKLIPWNGMAVNGGRTAIALVDFARAGEKRLALSWIDENCKPA